ncbi:MAG: septum site-determining protein MinD [Clostridia bacterium]|nr:septum site-determining protein MinD [Clostridia bacterium]
MAKKIVITSGKGGVGKTTVTANLGRALSNLGERVLLLDVDFGLNNLDVVMGLDGNVLYDISDVIEGRCRIKQALVQDGAKRNLFLLSSNNCGINNNISGQNIKLILENLSPNFDYILIDCPAGIDIGFHRAVACADEALVVVTPSLSSIRDADKIITALNSYCLDSVGLIINRVRGDLIMSGDMIKVDDIKKMLNADIRGALPEEDVMFLTFGQSLPKSTDSFKAYKILAENVKNGKNKIFDNTYKYSGFFGSIRRGIKKSV